MTKLLSKINTRITYIENNSTNNFILHTCDIIAEKMTYIKAKSYSKQETINNICDHIINRDIANMQGVSGETTMVYKKMAELAGFVAQIPTLYFEDDSSDTTDDTTEEE